jgi:Sulfotransferase domain
MADRKITDQSHPERAGATPDGMPSFVVIGAQKSASTFLQDQLSLHPEVEMPEGEVRHFEDPFYSQGAVADLPSLYVRPPTGIQRGIKRPDYMGRPEIPARLHEHLPEARLLAVLREPVARAVSSYFHMARHGFVPLAPLDEAFKALLDDAWVAEFPRAPEVLTFGLYGEQLSRYLTLYRPEQLLILEQRELITDPRTKVREAFSFIGVDPAFRVPEEAIKVSNKGVYSYGRLRLLRTKNTTRFTYSPGMDRRYPKRMTPWGWLYNAAVVGLDRTVLSRFDDGRPPSLSDRVRADVRDYYADDSQVLRRLLEGRGIHPDWL